jgi:hypothetical protein
MRGHTGGRAAAPPETSSGRHRSERSVTCRDKGNPAHALFQCEHARRRNAGAQSGPCGVARQKNGTIPGRAVRSWGSAARPEKKCHNFRTRHAQSGRAMRGGPAKEWHNSWTHRLQRALQVQRGAPAQRGASEAAQLPQRGGAEAAAGVQQRSPASERSASRARKTDRRTDGTTQSIAVVWKGPTSPDSVPSKGTLLDSRVRGSVTLQSPAGAVDVRPSHVCLSNGTWALRPRPPR